FGTAAKWRARAHGLIRVARSILEMPGAHVAIRHTGEGSGGANGIAERHVELPGHIGDLETAAKLVAEACRLGQLETKRRQYCRIDRREGARAFQVTHRCREGEDPARFRGREHVIAEGAFNIARLVEVIRESVGCRCSATAGSALELRSHGAVQRSLLAL